MQKTYFTCGKLSGHFKRIGKRTMPPCMTRHAEPRHSRGILSFNMHHTLLKFKPRKYYILFCILKFNTQLTMKNWKMAVAVIGALTCLCARWLKCVILVFVWVGEDSLLLKFHRRGRSFKSSLLLIYNLISLPLLYFHVDRILLDEFFMGENQFSCLNCVWMN